MQLCYCISQVFFIKPRIYCRLSLFADMIITFIRPMQLSVYDGTKLCRLHNAMSSFFMPGCFHCGLSTTTSENHLKVVQTLWCSSAHYHKLCTWLSTFMRLKLWKRFMMLFAISIQLMWPLHFTLRRIIFDSCL